MDLLTAMATAPHQPAGTLLEFLVPRGHALHGTWYVKVECFQRWGIDKVSFQDIEDLTWTQLMYVEEERKGLYCACGNPQLHRIDS